MTKELELLLPLLENTGTSCHRGFEFTEGLLGDKRVVVSKCGIGKVNAAIGAITMIDAFSPDLIINTGVAGGTGSVARVLDVVVGRQTAYHDVWCGPGTERGRIDGMPRFFDGASAVVSLPSLNGAPGVHLGLIASGDSFIDSPEEVSRIRAMYPDVMAVDMESAPIAHACHLAGVPFVSVRVVSDTPGEVADNGAQYAGFWTAAPQHTFETVRRIISSI